MRTRFRVILLVTSLVAATLVVVAPRAAAGESDGAIDLVRNPPSGAATVSVDSTFPGYGIAVLSDGRWIEEGNEPRLDFGDPDRLGNGGNTWVSAESDAEHWIRIDWPEPIALDEVEIWWSLPEWQSRAFRVEALREGIWKVAGKTGSWLAAGGRLSVVPLEPLEAKSLRVIQASGGGGSRSLFAVQEVRVFRRPGGPRPLSGARELRPAEARRLERRALEENVARLRDPGAASAVAWLRGGREVPALALADGDADRLGLPEGAVEAAGILWPIEHAVDEIAVVVVGDVPASDAMVVEAHDGKGWVPVRSGLRGERHPDRRRVAYGFEPVATRGIRVRFAAAPPPVAEIEVRRYLPPAKDVWPDRLITKGALKTEILAMGGDPSFESLALCALPMTPARALLGLADAPHEVGAAWDGTLIGRETLRFAFGEEGKALADFRDTVTRRLIDGWRPGVVVEGRIEGLAVVETAFVAPIRGDPSRSALFVRIEVENVDARTVRTCAIAELECDGLRARDGALFRGEQAVLRATGAGAVDGHGLRVEMDLAPGAKGCADFVMPMEPPAAGDATPGSVAFDEALASFRAYWDKAVAPAFQIEVPDDRIERMHRAVIAQLLINADGDIMRYGSEPSVYREEIFGVEEGYAITALAFWGFGQAAQRYLDGTYLTAEFLRKVDEYRSGADRHQQYRNGLEPHYAVEVYRLTRDGAWIGRHLPLLRECAEWTAAARRKTLGTGGGELPLHAGLLPEWAYGGDIAEVRCYALYANYACWRGLVDTSWLLGELGDAQAARKYAAEAREFRAAIDRAVDGIYRGDRTPPFLPLRLYADRPDEQMDYYQLFAGCILDLGPFEKGSRHFRWIADFMEEDNRTFCLLPRFRRDAGAGGLDAIYGKGYLLATLREDAIREFLLGFNAFLAFNMDRETFVSRETNVIYASDLHLRSRYEVPDMSDPVPCSSAVALFLLRHLLVTEEMAAPGELSGRLLLLAAAPRAWLRDGQKIRLRGAPTAFGPVSFEVRAGLGRIEAEIVPPVRNPCREIRLRLRHPEARPVRAVTIDGAPSRDFDPAGEWIDVPATGGPHRVVAEY